MILRTQDRFMCRIEAGVVGELTTLDMRYRITHVKACQGHDQSLIEKVGTAPLVKQIISLDYQFTVEDLKRGLYPRVPIYPHLAEAEVAEEFRIIYHYTSWSALQQIICAGIFPGASSCTRLGKSKARILVSGRIALCAWQSTNRHRLRLASRHSPGGNLGRSTHLRRLGPKPLHHLRI